MRKIFTIAAREYRAMVGTKAFVLSIVMMPILMLGSIAAMALLSKVAEVKERKIAVIDPAGTMFEILKDAADKENEALDEAIASGNRESKFGSDAPEKYLLERVETSEVDDELRFELSDKVRSQELYAFVEIPADAFGLEQLKAGLKALDKKAAGNTGTNEQLADENENENAGAEVNSSPGIESEGDAGASPPATSPSVVKFYSPDSSISAAKGFFSRIVNQVVREKRMQTANIDIDRVKLANAGVNVMGMGLASRSSDGTVKAATEGNPLKTIFLPMGVMMLMFMVIFMAAQPMLESVLEEKSQRIAEVLLGSANPFQLMIGKLLGTVAGSLTIFLIYLGGGFFLAQNQGWTEEIPFHLTPWFIAFQVVGVFFYAAIFMAVGASVSQLKEAQSLLLPVWMMMMCPMFIWLNLVRDPLGPLATGFSLFPPATPTTMMLRMTTGRSIPMWQPILGLALTIAATLLIVVLAARIFRVGILWQGKTPKLSEIVKWAIKGE